MAVDSEILFKPGPGKLSDASQPQLPIESFLEQLKEDSTPYKARRFSPLPAVAGRSHRL